MHPHFPAHRSYLSYRFLHCFPHKEPDYISVLEKIFRRNTDPEDESLTLTIDELRFLAFDPSFNDIDPQMAAEFRQMLENFGGPEASP